MPGFFSKIIRAVGKINRINRFIPCFRIDNMGLRNLLNLIKGCVSNVLNRFYCGIVFGSRAFNTCKGMWAGMTSILVYMRIKG
ncbi:MAG: hypothetical protein DRI89_01640 [Bacteroidetes bacterium]|nr:MAG: hypothetical protein DRI89_01640 [Bacteroidota bacterium]